MHMTTKRQTPRHKCFAYFIEYIIDVSTTSYIAYRHNEYERNVIVKAFTWRLIYVVLTDAINVIFWVA